MYIVPILKLKASLYFNLTKLFDLSLYRSRERRDRDRLSASRDDGEVDAQNNRRLGGGVGGGGPPSRFPDSHQLFVGNLPQNVQESELRVFFESK